MKIMGINCGRPGGNTEVLLKEALMEVVSLSKNALENQGGGKGILPAVDRTFTLSTKATQIGVVYTDTAFAEYDEGFGTLRARGNCFAWTYRGRENGCNVEVQSELAYCLREPSGGGSQPNICYRNGGYGDMVEGVGTLRANGGDAGGGTESIVVERTLL